MHSASWEASPFGVEPPDFYLLDDETVVLMAYDDVGHWLGGEVISNPADVLRYRRLRDLATEHSQPLIEYLAAFRRLPLLPLAFSPTGEPMTP